MDGDIEGMNCQIEGCERPADSLKEMPSGSSYWLCDQDRRRVEWMWRATVAVGYGLFAIALGVVIWYAMGGI